ncbi:MAG: MBL fold metallo-hydrolase [Tomitella sp.]|nr:MBL fold metallo-hydrolase [Tomitella sp.]
MDGRTQVDRRVGGRTRSLLTVSGGVGLLAGAALARELLRVYTEIGAPYRVLRSASAKSAAATAGRFVNRESSSSFEATGVRDAVRAMVFRGGQGRPGRTIPVRRPSAPERAGDLAATWLGHASVLLEVDGHRVLADPVLQERCSPSTWIGPARLHPAPVRAEALPQVDAVVISHDHYDHLERTTVLTLTREQSCPFLVPTGIAAHLRRWGVPDERIVELDWGGTAQVAGLTFTCSEVRHFSGRGLRRDGTQWAGWCVAGPRHRVFFGGDSGYTSAFADTGAVHGPFDLTVLPIGAYSELWPDVHMTPEETVRACLDLNPSAGTTLLPVHWATFDLAPHRWAEPVERLFSALDSSTAAVGTSTVESSPGEGSICEGPTGVAKITVAVPSPGERLDLGDSGAAHGRPGEDASTMGRWWEPLGSP